MNLTGSRPTLIANVCALIVASVVIAEGAYSVHAYYGFYMPLDVLSFLFPALAMFIIRSRSFSFFFLALYVALAIQMFFQAQGIYLGGAIPRNGKWGPLLYHAPFILLSASSLVVYVGGVLVHLAISGLTRLLVRQPPAPVGDDPPGWHPR